MSLGDGPAPARSGTIGRRGSSPWLWTCCLLLVGAFANAQPTPEPTSWELRVCADPDNLPYSDREGRGFENRIAAILAEELGARLHTVWLPLPRKDTDQELMLRMGACDVLLGVQDGQEPFLTTLAYYSSTAVFVQREDVADPVTSLDDPRLGAMRVGVRRGSPADVALAGRGYIENVQHAFEPDAPAAILEAVARGDLDIGIVWGPIAGYYTAELGLPLALLPVSPQIDMPFLPMVRSISLAVRRPDDAFRDLLNQALSARWTAIKRVLEDYDVPLLPLPEPVPRQASLPVSAAGQAEADDAARGAVGGTVRDGVPAGVRVGVVVPSLTGRDPLFPMGDELAGEPARRGAILADEMGGRDGGSPARVLIASAPTVDAAARAAARLLEAQDVQVLVGGVGDGQAERLGLIAAAAGVAFLNVGDPDPELRGAPALPTTFHIQAGEEDLARAVAMLVGAEANWFAVVPDAPEGERRLRALEEAMAERNPDASMVGSSVAPAGTPLYWDAFEAIAASGADEVVLLLDAGDQLVFLGQYETAGSEADVTGFPVPLSSTRRYYAALRQDAPMRGMGDRVAMWDASLASTVDAAELNARYLARWGVPMDPSAWAAYAAVRIATQAARGSEAREHDPTSASAPSSAPSSPPSAPSATAPTGPTGGDAALRRWREELLDGLLTHGGGFDVAKAQEVRFGSDDRQLRQPLYQVALFEGATDLRGLAEVVRTLLTQEALGEEAPRDEPPGTPPVTPQGTPQGTPQRTPGGAP